MAPILSELSAENKRLENRIEVEVNTMKLTLTELQQQSSQAKAANESTALAARSENQSMMEMMRMMNNTLTGLAQYLPTAAINSSSKHTREMELPWHQMIREVRSNPDDKAAINLYEYWYGDSNHLANAMLHNPIFAHRLRRAAIAADLDANDNPDEWMSLDGGPGSTTPGWQCMSTIHPTWLEHSAHDFKSAEAFIKARSLPQDIPMPGFGMLKC